jgi:ribonucleotide reductase alpha subunit
MSSSVPLNLKPFESILVYVDQSKKRKGSAAAYLSVWHVDIEDFIEMKVPVGQGKESKTKCEDLFYGAWELVGACSYLLISFWHQKESAIKAAKKAFLLNPQNS